MVGFRASGRSPGQCTAQDDVGRYVQRVADAQVICHQKAGASVLAVGDERLSPAYLLAESPWLIPRISRALASNSPSRSCSRSSLLLILPLYGTSSLRPGDRLANRQPDSRSRQHQHLRLLWRSGDLGYRVQVVIERPAVGEPLIVRRMARMKSIVRSAPGRIVAGCNAVTFSPEAVRVGLAVTGWASHSGWGCI